MAKLPSHILKALTNNRTSLGEHPSFPPEEEEKFVVNLLSNVFNELSDKIDIEDHEKIKSKLM